MNPQPSPAKNYFRALLLFNILTIVFLSIAAILNRQGRTSLFHFIQAFLLSFVFFIPYLFIKSKNTQSHRLILFIPLALSIIFASYMLYGFISGTRIEMPFTQLPIFRVRLWMMYVAETLFILTVCIYTFRRTRTS